MAEDFVAVATFHTIAEAQLARNYLLEQGLSPFLPNTEMGALLGNMIFQITLEVPAAEAERAAELLETVHERQKEREETEWHVDEDEDPPLRCLACGKAMADDAMKCPQCGWSYEDAQG